MGFLDQAKKLEVREGSLNIIMGEPGAGKTTFAGSFPKPMLYVKLNDDGGDKVLEGAEGISTINPLFTDPSFFTFKGGKDSNGRQTYRMVDKLNMLLEEIYRAEECGGYKSIVIDPFGELALDMELVISTLKGGKALNFDDRNVIQSIIHPVFKRIKKLSEKMHVILPVHTKTFSKKDTMTEEEYTKVLPNFTESTSKELCKYADNIMYIGVRAIGGEEQTIKGKVGYERYLITGCNPMLPTKYRLPMGKSLDNVYITDINYDILQETIKGL